MADEKYEIRLVKIEGTSESIVDAQEVPMEKLQVQCDIYIPHVLDRLDDG